MKIQSLIPKQHGAWSILISCFLLGTIWGGVVGVHTLLFCLVVLSAFLGRHATSLFLQMSKRDPDRKRVVWGILGYTTVILCVSSYLVLGWGLWRLLGWGMLAIGMTVGTLLLGHQRKTFTVGNELLGVLGLTLIAPASAYVAGQNIIALLISMWGICFIFFGGSVFHVRYLIRHRNQHQSSLMDRLKAGSPSIFFHVGGLIVVATLGWVVQELPSLISFAFLPMVVKSAWGILYCPARAIPIQKIGRLELLHTVAFLILTLIIFTATGQKTDHVI